MLFASTCIAQTASFSTSGFDGGGDQNVVAIDPAYSSTNQRIIAGTDVAGPQLSMDGGQSFVPMVNGLSTRPSLRVAGLAFNGTNDIWMVSGNYGTQFQLNGTATAGLYHWTTSNPKWVQTASNLHIAGAGIDSSFSSHLPTASTTSLRSTGNLIGFGPSFMYVGTFDNGVFRCSLSGTSCTQYGGTSGYYVRSLIMSPDPNDPSTVVFAAIDHANSSKTGVFKIDSTGTLSTLTGSGVAEIEELSTAQGSPLFYYAAGLTTQSAGGVWRISIATNVWKQVMNNPLELISVHARKVTGTTKYVVLAGTAANGGCGTSCQTTGVFATMDDTTAPVNSSGLASNPILNDPVGPQASWWKAAGVYPDTAYESMGNPGYAAQYIALAPVGVDVAVASGRAAPMLSTDFSTKTQAATPSQANWNPAVVGMQNTYNRAVAADSNGALYIVDTDWSFLQSQNHGASVSSDEPQTSGATSSDGSSGLSMSLLKGSAGTKVFYSNQAGKVYYATVNSSGVVNTTWVDTAIDAVSGGKNVLGLATKYNSTTVKVVAAVASTGLFLGSDSGSGVVWAGPYCPSTGCATFLHSAGGGAPSTNTVPIVVNGSTCILYDRDNGIYRFDVNVHTFDGPYSAPTALLASNAETGYIALNPAGNGTLYVSNDSGLYSYANALVMTSALGTPTTIDTNNNNGPLAWSKNANTWLYVAGMADGTGKNAFLKVLKVGTSSSLFNISDPNFNAQNAQFPAAIDVSSDGYIYLGMNGQGLYVGTYAQ